MKSLNRNITPGDENEFEENIFLKENSRLIIIIKLYLYLY